MPVASFIPAVIGAGATVYAANEASGAAKSAAGTVDARERERFEQARLQAENLRRAGDNASAVALEEAARAELGAERFEALSNEYADRSRGAAEVREDEARRLYDRIQGRVTARAEAGQTGADDILAATRGGINRLDQATTRSADLLQDAFGAIEDRYSPYLTSERNALSQLNAEFGLGPGEVNRTYRDSPAYTAALDASRVAEDEAIDAINEDAAISGTLYSGRRGEALIDRTRRGSYERAGIEQSYYQNYLNMLRDLSNPTATGIVSGYQTEIADRTGQNYLQSARDALGAETRAAEAAANYRLGSMPTGEEGAFLINALQTGDEGAQYRLGGANLGTAGTPYRMTAAQIPLDVESRAGSMITGNVPTGIPGSNYRLEGTAARNAAVADLVKGGARIYSNYLNRPQPIQPPVYYGGGT